MNCLFVQKFTLKVHSSPPPCCRRPSLVTGKTKKIWLGKSGWERLLQTSHTFCSTGSGFGILTGRQENHFFNCHAPHRLDFLSVCGGGAFFDTPLECCAAFWRNSQQHDRFRRDEAAFVQEADPRRRLRRPGQLPGDRRHQSHHPRRRQQEIHRLRSQDEGLSSQLNHNFVKRHRFNDFNEKFHFQTLLRGVNVGQIKVVAG